MLSRLLGLFFNLFEPLFRLGQRVLGVQRLGWLFVAPNLIVFGIFTFLPILINFVYATTGGVNLMPFSRPWTGGENFAILLECRNYLDLQTCRKDVFWRAMLNTAQFSVIQVVLMVFGLFNSGPRVPRPFTILGPVSHEVLRAAHFGALSTLS